MIDLTGRVAVVTGAGGGLGRSHALLLAQRGAKVAINDLGDSAEVVASQIKATGGEALTIPGSVTDATAVQAMTEEVLGRWGRIDVLVNNAGILRDKTFANMDLDDFRLVVEVHLMGAVNFTKAVWETMRTQRYGRIVMTSSSSGLYGNFGQSNYGAAKMALVGLAQTLALEGEKYNIRVNCLAPTAATQMMEGILPTHQLEILHPELVSPALLALVAENAPTRTILCAGASSFEVANITLTRGIHVPTGPGVADEILERWQEIVDRREEMVPTQGFDQARHELRKADLDITNP